jgi:hypothetical protein
VFEPGEVISYLEMCREEGISLQRGMNFRQQDSASVILMSRRVGAPYEDRVEENGKVLIYEGHDQPQVRGGPSPEALDQLERTTAGTLISSEDGAHFVAGSPDEVVLDSLRYFYASHGVS